MAGISKAGCPIGNVDNNKWIARDDGGMIQGRVQPRGGAWHAITDARVESGKLIVVVQEASSGPAMSWELTPLTQTSWRA
jgi:hypothetical protein